MTTGPIGNRFTMMMVDETDDENHKYKGYGHILAIGRDNPSPFFCFKYLYLSCFFSSVFSCLIVPKSIAISYRIRTAFLFDANATSNATNPTPNETTAVATNRRTAAANNETAVVVSNERRYKHNDERHESNATNPTPNETTAATAVATNRRTAAAAAAAIVVSNETTPTD